MRQFSILLLAALLAHVAAAESPSENFRACFCWNRENNTFCGGSDWYNRSACQNWFWQAFGFAIPAVVGLIGLLFFPLVFYISRIWCNCCGGRHRSYGLCCSDRSSSHRVPHYSNRSIFAAKLLMSVAFGAYIYYAVGGYTNNAKLHTDLKGILGDLGGAVNDVNDLVLRSSHDAGTLANLSSPQLVPKQFADQMESVATGFQSRVHDIHHVLHNIRRAEDNQSIGRAESVYRYPSVVLFVLLVIVIFMVCNVRKAMGPLMVLFCFASITEGLVFIPHMIIAQGASAMCGSYNQTVVPVIVGSIESQRGCNDPGFFQGADVVANNIEKNLWAPSQSSLCEAMRTVCRYRNCTYNTCGGTGVNGESFPFRTGEPFTPYNVAAIELVMTTPFQGSVLDNIVSCANHTCASQPVVQTAARSLAVFYEQQYEGLAFLLEEAYPKSLNCSAVRSFLHSPLHDDICTGVNRRMTNIAMVTGVMYLLSFLTIPLIIRGMKRFIPMRRNQSLADVARETIYYVDAKANAIPEQDPAATAYHTGYGAINDDDKERSAVRLADIAYQRRFYGPGADPAHRTLLHTGGEDVDEYPESPGAPGDAKPL